MKLVLLLSLSEHIAFNTAYVIASVSCAAVLGIYISGVLGEIKHGLLFSVGVICNSLWFTSGRRLCAINGIDFCIRTGWHCNDSDAPR
jgi:hypothetical protein